MTHFCTQWFSSPDNLPFCWPHSDMMSQLLHHVTSSPQDTDVKGGNFKPTIHLVAVYIFFSRSKSISPRSVQLSPMGSKLSWGLLADRSESRKFLCSNMECLCVALKSATKIHVQWFVKMYSSVSRLCYNQSLQSHLLGSNMTRRNIESSSCSREDCLQSIERLKAQPVSQQWDLTSGDHFEAAKPCTTQTFYTMFSWTLGWCYYTCFRVCKHSFKFKQYFLSCFYSSSF